LPVALVTGAGSGLGAATATALLDAGYRLAALDIDATRLGTLSDREDVLPLPCDLTDAAAIDAAVAAALDRFGRIDVVVNCAGIDHTYWLEQLTVEQYDQILAVNLRAPFLMAKAVWTVMKRQGGGQIVNIASTAATRVWPGASAYHASKFGLLGLSRAMNLEGRQENIRVLTVIPGGMDTRFLDRLEEQGIGRPDTARLQRPENVARTIVHALSMPADSAIQEIVITHPDESSWP
jgi:NAD(P)-dependent dehydrogenase (short-subunit alcohol dehydrogenase family)